MNYQLSVINVSAQHLARIRFTIIGDAYIIGVISRQGIGSEISISYVTSTDLSLPTKTIEILVISTYNSIPEYDVKNFIPVGVVDKNDGKIYGVFAKFS
jgi:hypothetical protein